MDSLSNMLDVSHTSADVIAVFYDGGTIKPFRLKTWGEKPVNIRVIDNIDKGYRKLDDGRLVFNIVYNNMPTRLYFDPSRFSWQLVVTLVKRS